MLPNDDLSVVKLAKMAEMPPEILEELQKRHPGMQVICVGDMPQSALPPEISDMVLNVEKMHARSLGEGRCIDCDKQMSNYPTTAEAMEIFQPEKGWTWFENDGVIAAWQCPDCDDQESTVVLGVDEDDDADPEDTALWTPAHERQEGD